MSATSKHEFTVWQTVTLEAEWYGDSFFVALASKNCPHRFVKTDEAEEMMSKLRGGTEDVELELFLVHSGQLGLKGNASVDEIITAAVQAGLEPCPRELAPYLLLKGWIPYGTNFHAGMRPIFIRIGTTPCVAVFYVNGYHNRLEHVCCCEGQKFCQTYTTWLFVKTRKG